LQIAVRVIYIKGMMSEKKSLFASLTSVCRVIERRAKSPAVRELASRKRLEFEAESFEGPCFSKRLDDEKKPEVASEADRKEV
jgi:hypothetical protein